MSRPFVTLAGFRFWAACVALLGVGCSERLTVVDAERLLDKAEIFDPVLCATPLRLRGGAPTFWGADQARRSPEAAACIDVAREFKFVRAALVSRGDPSVYPPSCLDGGIFVLERVPGQSEVLDGVLMLACGRSRVQIIDIAHEDHIARIFVRELREVAPSTRMRLHACALRDPDESWHDHVLDAYFARGEWHLGMK